MADYTTMRLTSELIDKLNDLKILENESYSNVIARLIKELEEAKELNDKLIEAIGK